MERIFVCTIPDNSKFAEGMAAEDSNYNADQVERCPLCGKPVSGMRWEKPRVLELTGKRLPDFLYMYGADSMFAISEAVYNKMQTMQWNGILSFDKIDKIVLKSKSNAAAKEPVYYQINVKRSRITLDHQKSQISYGETEAQRCDLCNPVPATYDFFRGIQFYMDGFEGYDVFKTYEMGDIMFFSERFVDFCLQNKFTNFSYASIDEYGRDISDFLFEDDF